MKKFILLLTLVISNTGFAAPSITVNIDGESYSCSKGGGSSNCGCKIVATGESFLGTTCTGTWGEYQHCIFGYNFGVVVETGILNPNSDSGRSYVESYCSDFHRNRCN